jgi:NADPH:quinone reductase-like Zn-dependent oxidoreductase
MRTIVYSEYGGPEVVRLADIDVPVAADDEILVKVHAAAVNPLDWHLTRGTPFPLRAMIGFRTPRKTQRLGADFAGMVAAVGRNVTQFRTGDAVFGGAMPFGSLAEYVTVRAKLAARKPERLTFAQAAGAYVGGVTAVRAVRNQAAVQRGQTVLINGAAGGVGTFAVQVAKALGGEVTGVQSTRNLELVRSIGADHVIDYTKTDFTTLGTRYDVIIDNVGNHSLPELRRALAPSAVYVGNAGGTPESGLNMRLMVESIVYAPFIRQKLKSVLARPTPDDVETLVKLMERGSVTPVVDRTYALADTAEALRYLETCRARGKVVVTVCGEE